MTSYCVSLRIDLKRERKKERERERERERRKEHEIKRRDRSKLQEVSARIEFGFKGVQRNSVRER